MAYTINKTNNAILTTIADGTIDDQTTDLRLIGKNVAGYGETLNENFVRLLENFASSSDVNGNPDALNNPIVGQLWYDTTNNILKVYNGSGWKIISSTTSGSTSPTGLKVVGDLWWDTTNGQLKAWNGSTWIVVGPASPSGFGTSGAIVESVTDSLSVTHTIVSLYTQNVRVAIVSADQVFTPSPAIAGFTTVKPGLNLASVAVIANNQYTGLVSDADQLDGLNSSDFMRATANTSTTGTLAVSNNNGLTVGSANDAKISIASSNVTADNQNNGGYFRIRTRSSGGVQQTGVIVDSNGHMIPGTNNVYNLGSSGARWNTVYATTGDMTAVAAEYADLAERYAADAVYVPGTVVTIGGGQEVTAASPNDDVFGVVSTAPAYLMNNSAGNDETHPPIALVGRVPCRVIGSVRKGEKLIVAANGVAMAAGLNKPAQDRLVGRALQDKYDAGEGVIEIVLTSH